MFHILISGKYVCQEKIFQTTGCPEPGSVSSESALYRPRGMAEV